MDNNLQNESKKHNVILNNGRELFIEGVTPLGELSIEGNELRITKYIMQSGEMCVLGKISALIYSETKTESKKRLFGKFSR